MEENIPPSCHHAIGDIFKVSIVSNEKSKIYLPELAAELRDENKPFLQISHIDRIVMEVLTIDPSLPPFEYIYNCYGRLDSYQKHNEIRNLICRYGSLTLLQPTLFNSASLNASALLFSQPKVLAFLEAILSFADSKEDKLLLITEIINTWVIYSLRGLESSIEVSKISILFDLISMIIKTDKQFLFDKWIIPEANQVATCINIFPFERSDSFLGNLFSRGPLNGFPITPDAKITDPLEYKNYVTHLHRCIKELFVDQNQRGILLTFFRNLLLSNQNKAKLQYDINTVSSFGFLFNILAVWLAFSFPFTSQGKGKVSAIDLNFLFDSLASSVKEDWSFPSFINASFYLTLKAIRLGLVPLLRYFDLLVKTTEEASTTLHIQDQVIQKLKKTQAFVSVFLLHKECFLDPLGVFFKFLVQLMVSSSFTSYSSSNFESGKEMILEDLLDVVVWFSASSAASQLKRHVLWNFTPLSSFRPLLQEDALGSLIIASLGSRVVSNPHLISKWIEDDVGTLIHGAFGDLRSLIQFWTEIEARSGERNNPSFYERFSIRYYLSSLMRNLWNNSMLPFRGYLVEMIKEPVFIKFIFLLVNDLTYLFDESIERLGILSEKDESGDTRVERECRSTLQLGNETLHLASDLARITIEPFLSAEIRDRMASVLNYHLVQLVGPESKKLKIHPKIKERLAWKPRDLLAPIISLYGLLGQAKQFQYSIRSDERSFKVELLRGTLAMVTHSHRDIVSPADGRLFQQLVESLMSEENAAPVINIKEAISKSNGDLRLLDAQTRYAIEMAISIEEEIPDEFLDPVMATIMFDPVRMATTSNIVIDRKTIKLHLLNDERDPFNRMPLKEGELKEEPELRIKIHKWIAKRLT